MLTCGRESIGVPVSGMKRIEALRRKTEKGTQSCLRNSSAALLIGGPNAGTEMRQLKKYLVDDQDRVFMHEKSGSCA